MTNSNATTVHDTTTQHHTTLEYATLDYITLLMLRYSTLHCISFFPTLHYLTLQLQLRLQVQLPLHYTCAALHCAALHHTTPHYTPLHVLHRTTPTTATASAITLHWLHYITDTPPLHYNTPSSTTTTALPHNKTSSCGWVTPAPTPKNATRTTFRSIRGFVCHPWFTPTNLFYRPPPCAVVLVSDICQPTRWVWATVFRQTGQLINPTKII